jgi:hypothetical protein
VTGAVATDEAQIYVAFRAQIAAMVAGDADVLADLLPADFTLSHITGYVQPRDEWLAQMRTGQFDYHRVDEVAVSLQLHGDAAVLTGRILTDATVYGTRANWRLVLTQDYVRTAGSWSARRSVATTW